MSTHVPTDTTGDVAHNVGERVRTVFRGEGRPYHESWGHRRKKKKEGVKGSRPSLSSSLTICLPESKT